MDGLEASVITPSGFSRHELVRLMVQSLQSLGYKKSAQELEAESGFQLESPTVTRFRECVFKGNWGELEQLIEKLDLDPAHAVSVKFLIREQKFLELLEARQIKSALVVLRSELTPLNQNMDRVHTLTSYMMSPSAEDLRQRADWDGANGISRQQLLSSLQKYISPAVMVPENRLETMLKQAVELQIKNCLYHDNRNTTNSLYSDHICDKTGIPSISRQVLDGHTNEVWYISFSHDGRYLASASADHRIIIWNLETFEPMQTLQGHSSKVSCCVWSPNDTQILTASYDRTVRLWNVQTATLKSTFQRHSDAVTCLGWLPDGERFVSGSEKNLFLMTLAGDQLRSWQFPVRDLAISADGKLLVAMGGTIIRVISLDDMSEISKLEETDSITSISLSKDGQHLLVNMTFKVIHLWNLAEGRVIRKYSGYKQGRFVIRSCFGGWDERFVISGSEDSKVYIWHRENGNLIQTLDGHSRAVTMVARSPTNPTMFASASDDHTIRM
ncbi:WD40-repeat-containing domain protein [Gamsiella multidivaricata]|uniref:WD40-repeat-containing domain protein n=1 Tax=Gamsiella multidivaricata TaxID=101098 RepID=UPI00221F8AF4|nr:WD40-repeat-containing domain protein [Gamsiella multidivaricata]KAI7824683.1 WD40-repeat-containing domain protein [Gamsiella multidivaricata]